MQTPIDLPPPEHALGAFLSGLSQLVLAEAESARNAVQMLWLRPLHERVEAGRAIEQVSIIAVNRSGEVSLHCPHNESRFREGDVLCLHRGNPLLAPTFLVTLAIDDDDTLVVTTTDTGQTLRAALEQRDGWILDEGYLDFSPQILAALDEAGDTVAGRQRVLPLLLGQLEPQVDHTREQRARERAEAWGLNDSQAEALSLAYAADIAYLIQGPPGTGKTRVLAHLAHLLAEEGERVLITAFTHRAINHALNTLAGQIAREQAPITAVKIGQPVHGRGLLVENSEYFHTSPLVEHSGGYVVGATPFATRTRRLSGVEFDTVIFDEASQITLPLAIMGMLPARRAIFVGDHKQLPPVLTSRVADRTLRESVFATLVERGFDTMLTESYRLNSELVAWPSEQFYKGELVSAEVARTRRVIYPRPPARFGHILDADAPKVFVDLGHTNARTYSAGEADLAAALISTLLECGFPASEIGVVVPFRQQARAIRTRLKEVVDLATRRSMVDTVERMQGQERDLIIVSLTTSSPTFAAQLADFLFQAERLNVAITRPRSKLIILGSRHLLTLALPDAEQQEMLALLGDLLRGCAWRSPKLGGANG